MQLICGVHGVGKTVFAKKLSQELQLEYYAASELISKKTNCEISNYKKVQHISDNQQLLLEALSEMKDSQYILDGHLCLINAHNKVERISYDVFKTMNIECIYLIVDFPTKIQERLKSRDKQDWNLGLISLFQQEEYEYAKYLAENRNIPLKVIYENKEVGECPFLKKENIILPIKPIFADAILCGKKKYEYRKRLCTKEINKIYIYATAPIKMIIGEAEVTDKLIMDKNKLWEKTKMHAGITKKFYDQYFEFQEYACAYEIGMIKRYEDPIALINIGIEYAPQAFVYVGELF